MDTVTPGITMAKKKLCCAIPALLLSGCSLSPSIPFIGAYYPNWLFCIIAGCIVTLLTRCIILRKFQMLAWVGFIYTALFALYSMLFWLIFF